jgi:predicted nucleotidyltransferase
MRKNKKEFKKIRKILLRYRSLLEKDGFPVKKMILYGSYARGNFKNYSDIDVCIISDKLLKNKDYYESYLWKKVLEVDPRIEPVGYHPKEFKDIDPLVNEIKREGIEIE